MISNSSDYRYWALPTSARDISFLVLFATFLFFANGGCSQLRETYYVGIANPDDDSLQFYRFRLRGDAWFTKTKFSSSWYSAAAIDALAGESVTDATSNAFPSPSANYTANEAAYTIAGPSGRMVPLRGKRLAIFMSSDIEAVTRALSQFARNEQLWNEIEKRTSRDKPPSPLSGPVLPIIQDLEAKEPDPVKKAIYNALATQLKKDLAAETPKK